MVTMTPEELTRVRHALNDGGSGILEMVVFAEWEKKPNRIVDTTKLLATYEKFQCANAAKLAEFLAEIMDANITMFGSTAIDLSHLFADAPVTQLGLLIGNLDRNIVPLEWLAYLANNLVYLPDAQIRAFDIICGEFYKEFQWQLQQSL